MLSVPVIILYNSKNKGRNFFIFQLSLINIYYFSRNNLYCTEQCGPQSFNQIITKLNF